MKNTNGTRMQVLNLGFDNAVATSRVVVIANAAAAAMKRLREEAGKEKRLVDVTQGRRTRAIVITDSGHVILSSVQSQTLIQRIEEFKPTKTSSVKRRKARKLRAAMT